MISGHGNIELAVNATRIGAYDFLEKPLSLERVLLVARQGARKTDTRNGKQGPQTGSGQKNGDLSAILRK